MLCTSGAYGIAQLHHTTCHIQTCRRKLKKGTQHAISYVFKASSRFSFCCTLPVSLPPEHFFSFSRNSKDLLHSFCFSSICFFHSSSLLSNFLVHSSSNFYSFCLHSSSCLSSRLTSSWLSTYNSNTNF